MKKISTLLTVSILLLCSNAFSFGTNLNSAKILKKGDYDLAVLGQFFSDDRRGAFMSAMIDLPGFNDRTNWRFYAGSGSFDYALGAQLKWIPLQQLDEKYFSFGVTFSGDYGADDGFDFFLVRAAPFISREFTWEFGVFEPYTALPLGTAFGESNSDFFAQIAVGAHFQFEQINYMKFSVEGGFNLENSQSYLAVLATVQLTRR